MDRQGPRRKRKPGQIRKPPQQTVEMPLASSRPCNAPDNRRPNNAQKQGIRKPGKVKIANLPAWKSLGILLPQKEAQTPKKQNSRSIHRKNVRNPPYLGDKQAYHP